MLPSGVALAVALQAVTPAAFSFTDAVPGYVFTFPADHASHPAYQSEWWYYTGHLDAASGETFGYQLTFFRVGFPPRAAGGRPASRWRFRDLVLAHFAVSDEKRREFRYFERLGRAALGLADARTDRYEVFTGGWQAGLVGNAHRLTARSGGVAIDLTLIPRKPPVVHGQRGVSQKADCAGCSSHYYSLTRLATRGTLERDGVRLAVTGTSWMDHEFGAGKLAPGMPGWDWYSVHLSDDTELMLYHLRGADGLPVPASSGTFVRADGTWRHLPREAFRVTAMGAWPSPHSKAIYPMGWAIEVPVEDLTLTLKPAFSAQELDTTASTGVTYWEGSMSAEGHRSGAPITGRGYVELTGYAAESRPASDH